LAAGRNTTLPLPSSSTVPWVPAVTLWIVSVSRSRSVSLPSSVIGAIVRTWSSLPATVSATATGASLRGATVTVTLPFDVLPLASRTV
jgi:hypothetical protein